MKTTTIILATLLTLQISFLFAGNESITATPATEVSFSAVSMLAPSTPAEATFEEAGSVTFDLEALAPATPPAADFEEMVPVIDLSALSPATPAEADFTDAGDQTVDIRALAPVSPAVADFE